MAKMNAPVPVKRKARLLNSGCYGLRPEFKNRDFPVVVNVSHVSRSGNLVFVEGDDLAALGFYGGMFNEPLAFCVKHPSTGLPEIELID
ncbi:hypothetical protein [Escherichia phage Henu8]|uniref:Uncharacterized protein n=1 Tax=Escherichia phage Henu8 TaxID=2596677 RepID=A0A5B8RQ00_9CAUD|nr:hypothetical protein H1N90_gp03 [Escherichia phage Henu8]QEA10052.1 hypothetical protein [Escherichia phage Henu8]